MLEPGGATLRAMAFRFQRPFAGGLGRGETNFAADAFRMILLADTYTYDPTHEFESQLQANELPTAGGYTIGGMTLGSGGWTEDAVNFEWRYDAADPVWPNATFTCRFAAIIKQVGAAAVNPIVGINDFEANQSPVATQFTTRIMAAGLVRLKYG